MSKFVVWYIVDDPNSVGNWPLLFVTKLAVEQYVRECFPDEDVDKRYARIRYREVYA